MLIINELADTLEECSRNFPMVQKRLRELSEKLSYLLSQIEANPKFPFFVNVFLSA